MKREYTEEEAADDYFSVIDDMIATDLEQYLAQDKNKRRIENAKK